jgi:hypothetical protein
MVHHVKDLSPNQRVAIENLLGRTLSDEESLTIRPARILKDAPVGDALAEHPDHRMRNAQTVPPPK